MGPLINGTRTTEKKKKKQNKKQKKKKKKKKQFDTGTEAEIQIKGTK